MNVSIWKKVVMVLLAVVVLQLAVGAMAASAASPDPGGVWHRVRWGETLFSIGRLYRVNPWAIARANRLPNPNCIYAGQALWIPRGWGPGPGPCPTCPRPRPSCRFWYCVRRCDTLLRIARRFGVSPWAIAHANRIYNLNLIYAGTRLCIP